MTTPTATIEAALDELRASVAAVDDEMFTSQLNLTTTILGNAITSAREGLNPARVGDIEFAFNDVVGVVDQLNAANADRVGRPIAKLRGEVERLKKSVSLPAEVTAKIKALQTKLRERRTAIERQAYVAGGTAGPPPHPPAELRGEAVALRDRLNAVGFTVPALDVLIGANDEFRLHNVTDLINELDVVLG